MSDLRNKRLWAIVGVGLTIRVVLAFVFFGTNHVLIEAIAGARARDGSWHLLYEGVVPWTYPPLFVPWLAGASWLNDVTDLSFHGLAKLGPTLGDVGLALAVYTYLGWRGAEERLRLAGVALIMLGPTFIATSGYHGQIDSVTILPAVLALMAWERRPPSTRALEAGLLIGMGAAVKTVPALMVLPLLLAGRSWREGIKLVGGAAVIPLVTLGPLWVAGVDLHRVTGYTGVAGWGGLSLALDPGLAWRHITEGPVLGNLNELTRGLQDASRWITVGMVAAYSGFIFRYRPALIDAIVLLWLAVYAFSPNFFVTYLVWGLPFFIMAGYLTQAAALQAFVIIPTVAYYVSLWPAPSTATGIGYVPFMFALWVLLVAATIVLGVRIARGHKAHPSGIQRPRVEFATARAE